MNERQTMITYALEAVPRPGARETRVRSVPSGFLIRNERGEKQDEEE